MGFLSYLLYPWGIILQGLAIVHFIRRRPDTYWIFIILFLGPLGAIVYLFVEALPDIGLVGQSFKVFPRRKRIGQLEAAIHDNPSAGNYEELGDLYMDDGKFQLARAAFDKAIAARADTPDPFYRRGICAIYLGDAAAALPDLERVAFLDMNGGNGAGRRRGHVNYGFFSFDLQYCLVPRHGGADRYGNSDNDT